MAHPHVDSAFTQREARIGSFVVVTLWILTLSGIAGLAFWSLGDPSLV